MPDIRTHSLHLSNGGFVAVAELTGEGRAPGEVGFLVREKSRADLSVLLVSGIGPASSSKAAVKIFLENFDDAWAEDTAFLKNSEDSELFFARAGDAIRKNAGPKAGATVSLAYLANRVTHFFWHGDARVYLYGNVDRSEKANGFFRRFYNFFSGREYALMQLTEDHTFVQMMAAKGMMTDSRAEKHPNRKFVLAALGREDAGPPGQGRLPSKKGDLYLLLNGAMSRNIESVELAQSLAGLAKRMYSGELPVLLQKTIEDMLGVAAKRDREESMSGMLVWIP